MVKTVREIRYYDYVNHSYERVRDVLRQDGLTVSQLATRSGVARAESVATGLHIDFGGIAIKADVKVRIVNVEEKVDAIPAPNTRLLVEWQAATMPSLFPVMQADLSIYPLTPTETQLDFLGRYEPPFNVMGKVINAVVGYRIAEVSVHSFLTEVAGYLRQTMS